MLCSSTLTLTTLSIDEPAASSIRFRLVRITRVSLMVVPCTRWPVSGSTAHRPDTYRNGPPRTIDDAGCFKLTATSRAGTGGGTTARCNVMGLLSRVRFSSGSNYIELDLEASLALRGPDRARRRPVGDILPIDAVEHVVFDAVVDQRVHLHQPIE